MFVTKGVLSIQPGGVHPSLIARTSTARSSTGITGSSPFLAGRVLEMIHDRLPLLDLFGNRSARV
jgi:hypothetical protein